MAFDKETLKARVQEKVDRGDFFFPEDLARDIAKALDVETSGTSLGQVPAAESPTRGSVPPFSGRPANESVATDETNERVAAFDEAVAERAANKQDGSERITRAELGIDEDEGLETEVKEEGPIFPDAASTDTDTVTPEPKAKKASK